MKRHWPLLLVYALLFAILRAWFEPGLIAGEDFWSPPFLTLTTIAHSSFWPPSWEPLRDLGQNMQPWWPAFPLWALAGALFRAGVSWPVLERLFWLWPYFVLVVALPYWFLIRRGVTPAASGICAALYAVNTWTIGEIERGHMPALVAYALIPAVVDRFLAILSQRRVDPIWQAALLLAAQTIYEVRYAYLTLLACAVLYVVFVVRDRRRYARADVAARFAGGLAAYALLTLYFWLPLLIAPFSAGVDTSMASFENLSGRMSLLHAVLLFYPYYHHNLTIDAFAVEAVEWPFVVLPMAAVAGWFAGRRRPLALPLAVLWMLALLVLAGPKSLFGFASTFVFAHVPGFKVFRDVTKLYAIATFALTCGIAFGLNRGLAWMRLHKRRLGSAVALAGLIAIALLMRDAFNPLRASNFAVTHLRAQDVALASFVDRTPGTGSVAFFPSDFPGIDPSLRHPIVSFGDMALGEKPFGLGALVAHTDYDTISSLLYGALHAVPLLVVLRGVGVQYVALVDDPERALNTPSDYGTNPRESAREFAGLTWLKPLERFGSDRVYAVRDTEPRRAAFYAAAPSPPFRALNASEIEGMTERGLLVQATAYDPGWRIALLPADAQPTGDPWRDFEAYRRYFVPQSDHVVVATDLNGWTTASHSRALLIFVPSALSELGALLELPALAIVGLAAWFLRR